MKRSLLLNTILAVVVVCFLTQCSDVGADSIAGFVAKYFTRSGANLKAYDTISKQKTITTVTETRNGRQKTVQTEQDRKGVIFNVGKDSEIGAGAFAFERKGDSSRSLASNTPIAASTTGLRNFKSLPGDNSQPDQPKTFNDTSAMFNSTAIDNVDELFSDALFNDISVPIDLSDASVSVPERSPAALGPASSNSSAPLPSVADPAENQQAPSKA